MWNCVKHVFWVKKVVGKNFFKNWNIYPLGGSELVKNFEKWVEKFFCVFSGLINVKLCETCFLSKKSCRKKIFSKIEIFTL